MKARSRIRPVSPKRQREALGRAAVRSAVFERDGWRCLFMGHPHVNRECSGHLTVHHLLKASAGGKYEIDNLVTLCSYHNDHCEEAPNATWALGLVIRRGETHEDAAARRKAAGL